MIDDPVGFHKEGRLIVKAWVFTPETGWIFRELTNKEFALWVKLAGDSVAV